jgi:hypothetical protein
MLYAKVAPSPEPFDGVAAAPAHHLQPSRQRKERRKSNKKKRNGNSSGKFVNFRDSKLTHLLKSSFVGGCQLAMIAAVNPKISCFEETQNTLKYATRAKSIPIRVQV